MTRFQHVAVSGSSGPHVTVLAGIDMASRYWTTTSGSAAKVRMLRSRPAAAVLRSGTGGRDEWTLTAGRAIVLDARRPCDGLADPVAVALAGIALARVGVANLDQLLGYLDERGGIPSNWLPTARVLLVVQCQSRLSWRDGAIVDATGAFTEGTELRAAPARRGRRARARSAHAGLSPRHQSLVTHPGRCALGLTTPAGPVVVPASWDPVTSSVSLPRTVLAHLGADANGPCSLTFDQSNDTHPSAKVGVMLRGECAHLADVDAALTVLDVRVHRVTSWDGFTSSTTAVDR